MSAYIEQQSDAAFTAWLSTLEPRAVELDRAAHATDIELHMIGRTRTAAPTDPRDARIELRMLSRTREGHR